MIILRILGSIILIALGIALMKYTVQITDFTGKIDFAEKYLASPLAGTYTWWRLVGLAVIIFSLFWLTGNITFLP